MPIGLFGLFEPKSPSIALPHCPATPAIVVTSAIFLLTFLTVQIVHSVTYRCNIQNNLTSLEYLVAKEAHINLSHMKD